MKGRDKRKLARAKSAKRKGAAPCKNKPGPEAQDRIATKVIEWWEKGSHADPSRSS